MHKTSKGHRHFISSARLIGALTLLSRILGLLRDAVCLRYFGTEVWHYFSMPFQIPNLFRRLFGEGALSAALIPVYSEKLHEDPHKAALLARSVVTLLVVALSGLTLLGLCVIYIGWLVSSRGFETWLVLSLTAMMLPYMILICTVATVGGLLNVHRHFAAPAAAPMLLNISIITMVIWFREYFGESLWQQIFCVAAAILIAGVLQLMLQYPALRKHKINLQPYWNFSDPALRKIMRLMAPMIIGLSVVQINVLMDSLITYFLSGTDADASFTLWGYSISYPVQVGSVAHLYCAQRLYHFPLGVFGLALATAIFPELSRQAARKNYADFSATLAQGIRTVVFLAIPVTVGIILIRAPYVAIIYERGEFISRDTNLVAWTLLFYSTGIIAYFMQQLVVRGYYSLQDSITPVRIAVWMVGLNFVLNLILIWPLGTGGPALATAVCAGIQVGILLWILIRRYDLKLNTGMRNMVIKTTIATLIMAGGGAWSLHTLSDFSALLQLLVTVPLCAALFGLCSLVLKNPELQSLFRQAPQE